jgi:hypothetical protein
MSYILPPTPGHTERSQGPVRLVEKLRTPSTLDDTIACFGDGLWGCKSVNNPEGWLYAMTTSRNHISRFVDGVRTSDDRKRGVSIRPIQAERLMEAKHLLRSVKATRLRGE